jgi:uncharacterized protein (DUF433 family)
MGGGYIERRNGGYYVAETRISLDSVVSAWRRGDSPEEILESYPLLGSLARVHGAIAFYLDNKPEIDRYLEAAERDFERGAIPLAVGNPELWERLQHALHAAGELRP